MSFRNLDDDPLADVGPKPSAEAETLRCPSCGAPVEFEARTCRHCQAELATVRCPTCFALERAGRPHCSHCAGSLELEGLEGATSAACPRCTSVPLAAVRVGEHRVAECMRCTGLFVEHPVLERITRRTEQSAGLRLRPIGVAPTEPETTTYLPCPYCRKTMGRRGFADRSGVIIDYCNEHGVWFDADELARVLEFIDAGGLAQKEERERRAAAMKRFAPGRVEVGDLPSYDMVASFLSSLLRP
ncbi:MAG: zf-TFIIB domain-containing protein [Sandaracinus sp.]